jgi:predicted transcriptional regulator of viral defense system
MMIEKPPPYGINCRCPRKLRDRQFIPSAKEDARPSVQASLRLRSRLAARIPTGSLPLRHPLRLSAWTRDCGSQRTTLVHAEPGFKRRAVPGLILLNSVIITLFVLRQRLLIVSCLCVMKRSSQESDARLFAVAESQGGYFTAKQAEEAGFDRTNHAYHVRAGNWEREHRGIFRLVHFPASKHPDMVRWSLWSRNRQDHALGVYSHQTALSIHDLSDLMPSKLHMTVPVKFRRNSQIPPVIVLHHADLPAGAIEDREGFRVTSPMRTLLDLGESQELSPGLLAQAFAEARKRGLITESEVRKYRRKLPSFLFQRPGLNGRGA